MDPVAIPAREEDPRHQNSTLFSKRVFKGTLVQGIHLGGMWGKATLPGDASFSYRPLFGFKNFVSS